MKGELVRKEGSCHGGRDAKKREHPHIPEIKIPVVFESKDTGISSVMSPVGSSGIPSPFNLKPLACRMYSSRRVLAPMVS